MNLLKKHHRKIFWIFTLTALFLTVSIYLPALPVSLIKFLLAILVLSGLMVFWINKEKLGTALETSETGKKNKWFYPIALALLVLLAFSLRVINLTALEPYSDAYTHLVSAMAVNDHGSPDYFLNGDITIPYTRAYFITALIAFLFSVFGKSLFIARLPGIIISSLTAIPFYFLGKRLNKPIGLITAALWAVSPWSIGVAKNVREYAYFPFFYMLFGLFLIVFAKRLIEMIEKKDWKITFKKITAFIIFFLPFVYHFLDFKSTFRQIFLLYVAFFIVFFYNFFRSKKLSGKLKKRSGLALAALTPIILTVYTLADIQNIQKFPHYVNYFWLNIVVGTFDTTLSYQANYYGFYILFAFALLFSIYWLIKNKSLTLNFLFLTFLGYVYFLSFHWNRIFSPVRYGFVAHLWLLPLIAVGIYLIYRLYLPKKGVLKKVTAHILLLAFLLTIIPPKNVSRAIELPYHPKKPATAVITNEFHERFIPTLEKYGDQIQKDDMIICTLCVALFWYEKIDLMENNTYAFNPFAYEHDERFSKFLEIILNSGQLEGWVIVDIIRNSNGLPKANFKLALEDGTEIKVNFIEQLVDYYIYRWEKE